MSATQVLVVSADGAFALVLRDVIVAQLADAACDSADPATVRSRPDAAAVVIDARHDTDAGGALARHLRAMGFVGAIVAVGTTKEASLASTSRDGYAIVAADRLSSDLMPGLSEQLSLADLPGAAEVMRARRLVAAGEIAQKLQHTLNNALMGLMAEAQLMQLDEIPDEHAAALERMVAICRRMIELSRTLDGLGDRKKTS